MKTRNLSDYHSSCLHDAKLKADKTEKLIESYLFSEGQPIRDEVLELIDETKPSLLESKKTGDRILAKIVGFVETFINGLKGKYIEVK